MRRRFFAEPLPGGHRAEVAGAGAAHLARVLRVRAGQEFELAVSGRLYLGRVVSASPDRVGFDLIDELPLPPAPPALEIAPALFKFDRFEWMLEKATELGATRIRPLVARRSEARLAQAAPARLARWRAVVHAAAQQSRRLDAPEIPPICALADFLAAPPAARRLLLTEDFSAPRLESVLTDSALSKAPGLVLLTGPEGGWAPEEAQSAIDAGFEPVSLGPRILRCETAVIAALARAGAF